VSDLVAALNGLSGPWAEALWRACWQGAVAFALVWLVCRAWPKLPGVGQCWLWRLAYLKLLLGLVRLPAVALPVLPARAPVALPPATPLDASPVLSAGARAATTGPTISQAVLPTLATITLGVWLVGLAWYASRVVGSWRTAQRLRLGCRPPEDVDLSDDLRELCWRNRVWRLPALLVGEVEGPLLLGVRHPVIVMPAALLSCCGAAEVRLILAHEVAHLRRRDLLWGWLPVVAEGLFFFHPLVWLGRREWRLSQEMACDALAVETTQRPDSEYGEMLVKVAAWPRARSQEFVAVGIVESYQALRRRLTAMAHLVPMTGRRWMVVAAVICLVAAAALVPWRLSAGDPGGQMALAAESAGGGGGGYAGGGGGGIHPPSALTTQAASIEAQRYSLSQLDPRLLRHYEVNKKVSDFGAKQDVSTPERTYAYGAHLLASGEQAGWAGIKGEGGSGGSGGPPPNGPREEVAPGVAKGWLDARIVEVWVYQERFAGVIAKVALPGESFYDYRLVGLKDGRWLNWGESQHSTIESARAGFARFCLVRYPEIVLEEKVVARAMDQPDQFTRMAQKLFQDIRGADYQHFLTSLGEDGAGGFPADYCVATDFPAWVKWVCTTFSRNPIVEVQLGKVLRNDEGLPTVPYTLTLKDGATLSGNLPFRCSVEHGRLVWQATTGLDWHLQPGG